jgi:hypothetical protein
MSADNASGRQPSGRRDWEYVTFDDYHADTKALADQAAGIIASMRKRAEQAERALAYAVLAAGGRISVDDDFLHDPRPPELIIERDECNRAFVLRARKAGVVPELTK